MKLQANCSAEAAGRISRDDISIIPTSFMARTTERAVSSTRTALMVLVRIPETLASSSLKVMAKSSLKKSASSSITTQNRPAAIQTSSLVIDRILPNR